MKYIYNKKTFISLYIMLMAINATYIILAVVCWGYPYMVAENLQRSLFFMSWLINAPISLLNFIIDYLFNYVINFNMKKTEQILFCLLPIEGTVQWTLIFFYYEKIKKNKIKFILNCFLLLLLITSFFIGYNVYNKKISNVEIGKVSEIN